MITSAKIEMIISPKYINHCEKWKPVICELSFKEVTLILDIANPWLRLNWHCWQIYKEMMWWRQWYDHINDMITSMIWSHQWYNHISDMIKGIWKENDKLDFLANDIVISHRYIRVSQRKLVSFAIQPLKGKHYDS